MRPPYVLRMMEEKRQLDILIDGLTGWIANNDHFRSLTSEEQADMRDQLHHMRGYAYALGNRLRRADKDNALAGR